MCKIVEIYILLVLILMAVQDIRKREVSVWYLLLLGIGVVVAAIACPGLGFISRIAGALVGVAFLILGRLTGEAIGYGDGIVVLFLGFYQGIRNIFTLTLIAFMLAGVVAVYLLCRGRKRKRKGNTIPLIPFLTIAYMGVVML